MTNQGNMPENVLVVTGASLLGTSASLLVTSALLVVTMLAISKHCYY